MRRLTFISIFVISFCLAFFMTCVAFRGKPKTSNPNHFEIGNCSWNTGVTRPINSTSFTVDAARNSRVYYTISINCTATIGSNAAGSVKLQFSIDGGTNWSDGPTVGNSNVVTLAVVIGSQTINTAAIAAEIPAGGLVRLVSSSSGTTTITYISGMEITYDN